VCDSGPTATTIASHGVELRGESVARGSIVWFKDGFTTEAA
jgi:hypothetical protein